MSQPLTAESLLIPGAPTRIGRRVEFLAETDSTNSYALNKIAAQGPVTDGHLVFSEYQTAGRGRMGRSWDCPRGAGVMFTALLWERPDQLSISRLIMATALAVARGIESSTDVETLIRWPNDIYVKSRKVAGTLVEARAAGTSEMPVAIGVGINCLQHAGHFPAELRASATSLEIESRHAIDRAEIARAVLRELDGLLKSDSDWTDESLARAWMEKIGDVGERFTLSCDGQSFAGRVLDVHPQTGLLLQLDTGARRHFDLATISRT